MLPKRFLDSLDLLSPRLLAKARRSSSRRMYAVVKMTGSKGAAPCALTLAAHRKMAASFGAQTPQHADYLMLGLSAVPSRRPKMH
jgi:hypothetical protein